MTVFIAGFRIKYEMTFFAIEVAAPAFHRGRNDREGTSSRSAPYPEILK
ncbi:hypothetical protein ACFLXA_05255 [Chloroflexota bacterium]